MAKSGWQSEFKTKIKGIWLPLILTLFWELLIRSGKINPQVLPAPSAVFVRWYQYLIPAEKFDPAQMSYVKWMFSGELIGDLWASFYRVFLGFAIGAGLALPIGLLMGASNKIYDYCNPTFQILRPIPPIAFIPLAILWFGLGNPPAVFVFARGGFF